VRNTQQTSATLQTADRALQILQQFRTPGETLTVGELATRLGVHRSTASRLVSTIVARGFLERTPGERVRLGPEATRLGGVAVAGRDLLTVAKPIMDGLAADTGEAVTLAVPAGREVLTVAESDGAHFVSSGSWVGVRTPLHCAADGKVLLAFGAAMPSGGALVRMTQRTITDHAALDGELSAVRRRGFAVARGELEEGLNGLAVPVWDGGACVAALCVSGPQYRLRGGFERTLAPACLRAARELEHALGGDPSPAPELRAVTS
jgi:IclR family transcriptional regulator, acetate operon repressor